MGYSNAELSILLTDEKEIAELNSVYRGVDSPTDVLSFPMDTGSISDVSEAPILLGDVVIAVPVARKTAEENQVSLELVIDVLLCHSVLHLIGYTHDNPENAKQMDDKTVELLEKLGYQRDDITWYLTSNWYLEE